MKKLEGIDAVEFRKELLDWFERSRRDLPWRRDYSPYVVWISEVMLQQTQVKTVLPYFRRWMERFPDVESVARAPKEELLKHWEGMGYYSRLENIRKAAEVLVRDFNGEFPESWEDIVKLPGIGPYTAGAIMSFAFNREYPVVDVNVERVLARVFNISTYIKGRDAQRFIRRVLQELMPQGHARVFSQALMELGATVCTARKPRCLQCPVRSHCESFRLGLVEQRPDSVKRKAAVPLEAALGVLFHEGRMLIQKRPPVGLMANLWEFPGGKLRDGESPEEALVREFREELNLHIRTLDKITVIRHSYTSFKVTLHTFFCEFQGRRQTPVLRAAVDVRWVKPGELNHYAFPAANRKLIKLLEQNGFAPS